MDALECLLCGSVMPLDVFSPLCPRCHEPMVLARTPGERRPRMEKVHPLERWLDFLPFESIDPALSLGEGNTPLVRLDRLAAEARLPLVAAKLEAANPTSSFKDRGTAVAVQKAASLGFKRIGTCSTGNMAVSTAAYGARAGLDTTVLLKEEASASSLLAAAIHGPRLIRVRGDYGSLFYRSLDLGRELGIYFMNSVDPFRIEGYKLTAFEAYLQLGRRPPGYLFVPVSSGGHLVGLVRAFEDLVAHGLIDRSPVVVGVQAAGCAPLAKAFAAGLERYERLAKVKTIAQAISNPAPPAGNSVLKLTRAHGGRIIAVTDEEIMDAQRDLAAREGVFCQPESAVTWAGLRKMSREEALEKDASAVLVLTGSGIKALHALEGRPLRVEETSLEDLGRTLTSPVRP